MALWRCSVNRRKCHQSPEAEYTSKGYFDNQMHTGRVGVTRYFNWGD